MPAYVPPAGDGVSLAFGELLDTTHPVSLQFGVDAGAGGASASGAGNAVIGLLSAVTGAGSYDNSVHRGVRTEPASGWGGGVRSGCDVVIPWGMPVRGRADAPAAWSGAVGADGDHADGWRLSGRNRSDGEAGWRDGVACADDAAAVWSLLLRRRGDVAVMAGVAASAHVDASALWAPMLRRRVDVSAVAGVAGMVRRDWSAVVRTGVSVRGAVDVLWRLSLRPVDGARPISPPPPPAPGCYVPPRGDAVELLFIDHWFGPSAAIRFSCRVVELPATYTIPYMRIYMAVHALQSFLLPNNVPVVIDSCTISADADGFCWQLQATGPGSQADALSPDADGPKTISIVIDGMTWMFAVERVARSRRFGESSVQIQGRSVSALLGAPYAIESTWGNPSAPTTGIQIASSALDNTPFTLDAGLLDDWAVPAGAWSHSGTPLSVVQRIAEAVGAVVVSARADPVIRLLPRYPLMPSEWMGAAVAPDVRLPLASVISDSYERRDMPAYNRAVVSGQSQGVRGVITRAGSGGTLAAPLVTDPLITAQAAAVQRGRSILGAAGRQSLVTLEMPVLSGGTLPGVLSVGQLVEVIEPGETWRGMARGITLRAGLQVLTQTVTLERHYEI